MWNQQSFFKSHIYIYSTFTVFQYYFSLLVYYKVNTALWWLEAVLLDWSSSTIAFSSQWAFITILPFKDSIAEFVFLIGPFSGARFCSHRHFWFCADRLGYCSTWSQYLGHSLLIPFCRIYARSGKKIGLHIYPR